MAELEDVRDLGSRVVRRVGSIPTTRTTGALTATYSWNQLLIDQTKTVLRIYAGVMELVDLTDSKSVGSDTVWVRVPPPAPAFTRGWRNWQTHQA